MDPPDALWLLDDELDEPVDVMKALPGVRSGLARRLEGDASGWRELRERCDEPFDMPRRYSRSRRGRSTLTA